MTRALEALGAAPWAIEDSALRTILEIAERTTVDEQTLRRWQIDPAAREEALAARQGTRLPGTRDVTARDGVAVLPIVGPVFPRANLFTEFSGAVSLTTAAQDLQVAADDPAVSAIVLAIDSPGGQVPGVAEFAALTRRIHADTKPVTAYVEGWAASAAYWIAAGAGQIVMAPSASVGSVGAVIALLDTRARDEGRGVREWRFISAQSPRKQADPATDEGRDTYQEMADETAAVFIAQVAALRGVSEAHVLERFGRGGMVAARRATHEDIGMADRVAVLEDVLAELAGRERGSATQRSLSAAGAPRATKEIAMSETQTGTPAPESTPDTLTLERVKAHAPDVAAALIEEGRAVGHAAGLTEGATAERERMTAIEDAALPGHETLTARAKAEGMAPEVFMAEMVKAEKGKREAALGAMKAGAAEAPAVPQQRDVPAGVSACATPQERAEAAWAKDAKLRAEFGQNKAEFLAWAERFPNEVK